MHIFNMSTTGMQVNDFLQRIQICVFFFFFFFFFFFEGGGGGVVIEEVGAGVRNLFLLGVQSEKNIFLGWGRGD